MSKSIAEIIDKLRDLEVSCDPCREWEKTVDEAISLLKTHPDNQSNEPLTLEELDGMEGERVFVSGHRDGIIPALVGNRTTKNNAGQFLVFTDGGFCRVKFVLDYGGKIYRRPPKEET